MPLTKSAKKKMRQDKKRQKQNRSTKDFLKETLKKAKKNPTPETIRVAIKSTDKAAKKQIIHKNKAGRIKSALSKLTSVVKEQKPAKKTTAKKNKK